MKMTTSLKESLPEASERDKRKQWEKVEEQFQELRKRYVELVSLDKTQDVTEVQAKFSKEVETLFVDTQKWILGQLKESETVTSGGAHSSRSSSSMLTKKEAVQLPHFKGEEKATPILKVSDMEKAVGAVN